MRGDKMRIKLWLDTHNGIVRFCMFDMYREGSNGWLCGDY
jgi:hypothetical protein